MDQCVLCEIAGSFRLKRRANGGTRQGGHLHRGRRKHFKPRLRPSNMLKVMLNKLLKVTAGTLNPHLPKRRMIEASEIEQWIEERE
jgi:hypothetical protein